MEENKNPVPYFRLSVGLVSNSSKLIVLNQD